MVRRRRWTLKGHELFFGLLDAFEERTHFDLFEGSAVNMPVQTFRSDVTEEHLRQGVLEALQVVNATFGLAVAVTVPRGPLTLTQIARILILAIASDYAPSFPTASEWRSEERLKDRLGTVFCVVVGCGLRIPAFAVAVESGVPKDGKEAKEKAQPSEPVMADADVMPKVGQFLTRYRDPKERQRMARAVHDLFLAQTKPITSAMADRLLASLVRTTNTVQ